MRFPRPTKTDHEPPKRYSLTARMFLLIGVFSLGPLLVTNLVGYLTSYRDVKRLSTESLAHSATVAAIQSEVFFEEKERLVSSLVAGNEHLRATMGRARASLQSGASNGEEQLDVHLRAKAQQDEHAVEFYVLGSDGEVLGSSSDSIERGLPRVGDPCRGSPEAPGVALRAVSGAEVIVSRPIRQPGGTIGTFCARFRFDLSHSSTALDRIATPRPTLYMIDAAGTVVCCAAEPVDGPRLAAVAPIAGLDWSVVAEVGEEGAFASLHDLRIRVLAMGGGLGVLVLVGMVFAVGRTVAPLRDIVRATRNMQKGELDQQVRAGGPREVAELAEVFNNMSSTVADLHANLEDRVEQRTLELRYNQAFTTLLFNSMDDNLLVIDASLVVLQANQPAKRTYGEPIEGEPCYRVLKGLDSPCVGCPIEQVIVEGRVAESERVHSCRGRSEIMNVKAFPLPKLHEDEEPKALLVTRAVTDEKHYQAHMIHHEKMSTFALLAAGVAHEIGNPLASIKAQVQLALKLGDTIYTDETLSVVEQEVGRIERLLRQLVGIARRSSSDAVFISWNQIARDVCHLVRHDPRSERVTIELDLDERLPAVSADEDSATQVLLNLCLNAIEAIGGRGTLTVETTSDGDSVVVTVRDTGSGVPDELRALIFEPSFTTKHAKNGTGLGLFVSRRIIEDFGGQLTLVDRPSGGGTVFEIRMPTESSARGADIHLPQ